ncbi:hypothetical protein [Streptomyces sp. NPDC052107]|uniref:hypothetical protein n=1 Tax=Streptomyces sp. NPDC052107 TaxID=3155632 RepID=UPI00343AC96A
MSPPHVHPLLRGTPRPTRPAVRRRHPGERRFRCTAGNNWYWVIDGVRITQV